MLGQVCALSTVGSQSGCLSAGAEEAGKELDRLLAERRCASRAATLPQGQGQVGRWPCDHHRAAGRRYGAHDAIDLIKIRTLAEAHRERYGSDELPGLDADSEIPALIQGTVNASSPAWRRLDMCTDGDGGVEPTGPAGHLNCRAAEGE